MKLIASPDLHGTICRFLRIKSYMSWWMAAIGHPSCWRMGRSGRECPREISKRPRTNGSCRSSFPRNRNPRNLSWERWKLMIWKMWMWSTWKDVVPRKLTLWLRVMAVCLLFLLPLSLPKSTETDSWKGWTKSIQPMASRLTRWTQPGSVQIAIRCRIDGILWTCLNMSECWMESCGFARAEEFLQSFSFGSGFWCLRNGPVAPNWTVSVCSLCSITDKNHIQTTFIFQSETKTATSYTLVKSCERSH